MAQLLPCPGCARHVRAGDGSCPFCGAALEACEVATVTPPQFTGRAQMFGFRATVGAVAVAAALGTTACGAAGPVYGAPPADAGPEADGGGPAPLYGAPPDAGQGSDSRDGRRRRRNRRGWCRAAYGAPGPDDAGTQADSGGGAIPLYGGPPAD